MHEFAINFYSISPYFVPYGTIWIFLAFRRLLVDNTQIISVFAFWLHHRLFLLIRTVSKLKYPNS